MDTYDSVMFLIYLAMLAFLWMGLSDFIRISYVSTDLETLLKVKKHIIPRIPFACTACMYLYLLTAALRLFLFADSLRYGGQIFSYICMFMVICILSGLNLISTRTLYGIGAASQVKRGWITLKLAFLPFLPLNAWLFDNTIRCIDPEVIGYTLLLLIPLWPIFLLIHLMIPVIFPLILDVANGCIGISYIRYLRQQTGNKRQPSGYHFGVQMIPGLDLVSTLFILIKYRKSRLGSKAAETNSVTMQYPCASQCASQCAPQSPYASRISYAGRSPYDVRSPYTVRTSYADRSPHASQPPYAAQSLCPYRTASAAAAKIYKKLKKHGKSLFLLYLLCGTLLYFSSEIAESIGGAYEEVTAEETVFYEMTEEEVELIQSSYWEKETKDNIAAGQLTSFQAELLENIRNGYSYIESKYPAGQFQIKEIYHKYDDSYYIRDTHTTVSPEISYYTMCVVPVQPNGRTYRMEFSTSPDSVVEDNLYAYLQEDSYFQYIEEQLDGEVPEFAKLDTDTWYDWYTAEYEDPAALTVEAVQSGEYFAGPRFIYVYIAADGKTADECEQQKEALSEIFHRIELPVERYTIRYYDLAVEEILVNDLNSGDAIAAFSIYGNISEDSP